MSIDAGTKEQAAEALRKVMHERCSNFDRGAVVHWAERGYYVTADEITALRARLEAVEKERDAARDNSVADFMKLLDARRRAERAEAALATARRDGFLAGFKASGEGWNGECPYEGDNPLDDKYFVDVMEREIRALANEAET